MCLLSAVERVSLRDRSARLSSRGGVVTLWHPTVTGLGRQLSVLTRRSRPAGRSRDATRPMRPATASATIARAYERVPEARSETRIVPAIAVPKDEPRLDTLRDRPEISPCYSSGKLDCTTVTDGVSITPRPKPMTSSPGTRARTLGRGSRAAAPIGRRCTSSRRRRRTGSLRQAQWPPLIVRGAEHPNQLVAQYDCAQEEEGTRKPKARIVVRHREDGGACEGHLVE